jgi:hypothetical protein
LQLGECQAVEAGEVGQEKVVVEDGDLAGRGSAG